MPTKLSSRRNTGRFKAFFQRLSLLPLGFLAFLLLFASSAFAQNSGVYFSGVVQTPQGPRGGASITVCSTAVIASSPTGATESGTTVTITTQAAHGFVAGQSVQITGVANNLYNGTFAIQTVPATTTLTVTNSNSGLAASGGGLILPNNVPCSPTTTIYADIGLVASKANPTTSDGLGNFSFFAPSATYVYTVTGNGILTSSGGPFLLQGISTGANNAFTGNNTFSGSDTFTGPIGQTGTLTPVNRTYSVNQSGLTSFYVDWARPSCTGPQQVGSLAAFSIHAEDTPTYDSTLSSSTPCYDVALFSTARRSGARTDFIWGYNTAVAYNNAGSTQGMEIDFANNYQNFTIGGTDTNTYAGIGVISQGAFSPDKAFAVDRTGIAGLWRRGLYINAVSDRAIEINGTPAYGLYADNNLTNFASGTWNWKNNISTNPLHSFTPAADDTNTELYGTNAANTLVKWSIGNSGAAVFPTMAIGGGTTLTLYRRIAVTLSPVAIAANTCAAQSFTVTGLAAADILIGINKPTEQAGLSVTPGHVSAANTATLNFCNNTVAAITPTAGESYSFVAVQ